MSLTEHLHFYFLPASPKPKELKELYISVILRRIATGMIGIFEPIYLFLYFEKSLSKTFFYFASLSLLYAIFAPLGGKALQRFGLKHSITLSIPTLFFYYLILFQINVASWFIIPAMLFNLATWIFFWPAYHTDFIRSSDHNHRGRQYGFAVALSYLGSIAGPVAGGFIIADYGFDALFIAVLFILISAAVPLFFSKDFKGRYHDSYEKSFNFLFSLKNIKKTIAFAGAGAQTGIHILVWPVFLFMLAINFSSIGVLTSATVFLGILFSLAMGKITDKSRRHILIRRFSPFFSIISFLKFFSKGVLSAFLFQSLYGIAHSFIYIPYVSIFYDDAEIQGESIERYVIYREMAHHIGRASALFLIGLLFYLSPSFFFAFAIAALGTLFIRWI
jgi:MFS family permease